MKQFLKIQEPLNFPLRVNGYDRQQAAMKKITQRLVENHGSHTDDAISGPAF